jgi:hypothetical protein
MQTSIFVVLAGRCPGPALLGGGEGHNTNGNYLTGKPIRHTQGRELCRTAPLFGRGASQKWTNGMFRIRFLGKAPLQN